MKNRNRQLRITVIAIMLIICVTTVALARTGGAGGGGSSSRNGNGDGGIIFYLVYFIIRVVPFPFNLILIGGLILAFILYNKKKKQSSAINRIPETGNDVKQARGFDHFLQNNPQFVEAEFLKKAEQAFLQIGEAWTGKQIGKVRRFITDGVYQRFSTQLKMMDILGQTNKVSGLEILSKKIAKIESDGYFDILTVAFQAQSNDRFISEKYPRLNNGGFEIYVEYWSFIRKRGVSGKDLYSSSKCPSCGGELPDEDRDIARCPFCSRLSNTGEYDWVLAEITQADDFLAENTKGSSHEKINAQVAKLVAENQDFSVQFIEDRVSNAFLQMVQSDVSGNLLKARRFVTDSLFSTIESAGFYLEKGFVYNRLYLNNVVLVAAGKKEGKNLLAVSLKMTSQRVVPQEKAVDIVDPVMISRSYVLLLERDETASVPAGSVFSYSCPHCGGELKETSDIKCQYCGEAVNSSRFDWVIGAVMTLAEYQTYFQENKSAFDVSHKADPLNALYHVRDYAFNNVLIMLASDGVLAPEELAFANELAKKWGYSPDKINGMMQMARYGRLTLRMPQNPKDREKIYKLMIKAAEADHNVAVQEKAVLDSVRNQFKVGE